MNDIMGGMFGAIGALAALMQRGQTGKGQEIDSALFENNVFLVGQHMMQYAVTGQAAAPMPERISSWGLYDVFNVKDGEQIFLSAVSDAQWRTFCTAMGFEDMLADPALQTNNDRVRARDTMLPQLRARLAAFSAAHLAQVFEMHQLPYAPISRPEHLLDDPHLLASGGLADVRLSDGERAGVMAKTTLLPVRMDGERLPVRMHPTQGRRAHAGAAAQLGLYAGRSGGPAAIQGGRVTQRTGIKKATLQAALLDGAGARACGGRVNPWSAFACPRLLCRPCIRP